MPHRELQIVFQKWLPVHFRKLTIVALVTISIVIVIVCQRSAVLLPPNIPNQSTKLLKAPAESSQFMRDSETVWVNVGPEMFVFSAYLDTRDNFYSSKPRRVVALAMQNDRMKHALLYCQLTDSNGHTWCLKHHISKIGVKKHPKYKYQSYYYICNLPPRFSAITPKFVSFSFSSSCQQPSPPIPVTRVQNTSSPAKGLVSVLNHHCLI